MFRIAVAVLFALSLGACSPEAGVPEAEVVENSVATDTSAAKKPIAFGTSYQLPSALYGEPREINIYVPDIPAWGEGYFADPLPVLYLVDGGRDQDFFHIAGLSQLTTINAERQPMIVVGIRTHDRRPEISPPALDPRYQTGDFEGWGDSARFRAHITDEVMPFVESLHTTGRSALMGESLAGLFIVETLLLAPDTVDDYIAISPSLWWDNRRLSREAPARLAAHSDNDRRLYLTMADEGGTMQLGLDELRTALAASPNAPETKWVDRSAGDTHSSIYHHAARDALTWLQGIPAEPYGNAPWYLVEGGERPAEVSSE